jgi:hypothetical protein
MFHLLWILAYISWTRWVIVGTSCYTLIYNLFSPPLLSPSVSIVIWFSWHRLCTALTRCYGKLLYIKTSQSLPRSQSRGLSQSKNAIKFGRLFSFLLLQAGLLERYSRFKTYLFESCLLCILEIIFIRLFTISKYILQQEFKYIILLILQLPSLSYVQMRFRWWDTSTSECFNGTCSTWISSRVWMCIFIKGDTVPRLRHFSFSEYILMYMPVYTSLCTSC